MNVPLTVATIARLRQQRCCADAVAKCDGCGATLKTRQDAICHFCNPYAPPVDRSYGVPDRLVRGRYHK